MFSALPPTVQHRLQYSLAISALIAGVAAVITLLLAAIVLLIAGLPLGHPLALFMPKLHILPGMMPRGSLDSAAWLMLITAYSGLLVGVTSFVVLYLGRADAN